jgi:hypothetical protein
LIARQPEQSRNPSPLPQFFVSVASKRLKLTVSAAKSTVTGLQEGIDFKRFGACKEPMSKAKVESLVSVASKELSSSVAKECKLLIIVEER